MTAEDVYAALDVGSNTVRLAVAAVTGTQLRQVEDQSDFVRLGKEVDATGMLRPDRMKAALRAIRKFITVAHSRGANDIVAFATSAVRDATNGAEFAQRVENKTGIPLRILSGQIEATLTAMGALSNLDAPGEPLIVDLGGGSAELVRADGHRVMWGKSLKLGSGRMTERFIKRDPPSLAEIAALEEYIESELNDIPVLATDTVVLTGGTATNVARLAGTDGTLVNLTVDELEAVRREVVTVPSDYLVRERDVRLERARVLPAGVVTLAAIVRRAKPDRLFITRSGIREGALIDHLQQLGRWPHE